jgi:riboflavin synthase
MFTGIVMNQGILEKKTAQNRQVRLSFRFKKKEARLLKLGESIAVNGVCLTVSKLSKNGFDVDVIQDTLQATTLSKLKAGQRVNLERSLKLGDEIGGHFVTGHVDGIGKIVRIQKDKANRSFYIEAPKTMMEFVAQKGSITVDGISLTVQARTQDEFKVSMIPFTLKETTFSDKKAGDTVNLEIDLVSRYLKIFSEELKPSKRLKVKQLKEQGF